MSSNYTELFKRYLEHSNEKEKGNEVLSSFLQKNISNRTLDYGCGTGAFLKSILPYSKEIIAMDEENRLSSELQNNSEIKFIKGNLFEINFTETFDTIIAAYVLWEIPFSKWNNFLNKCKKIISSNGKVIIIDSAPLKNFDNPFFNFNHNLKASNDYPDWYEYLNKEELSYKSYPFTSEIKAKDEEEMYLILEFFFQSKNYQKFYSENRQKIINDFKSKKTKDGVIITMHHAMDILSFN